MLSTISIPAANVAQLQVLGFREIQIEKSSDYGNSWAPITAHTPLPAGITSYPAATTWTIGGSYLRLAVSGELVLVMFPDTVKNWTPEMVVARINQAKANLASVSGASVRLTTSGSGRGQFLDILTSPPGLFDRGRVYGVDPNLVLDSNVFYSYTDLAGDLDVDQYRWSYTGGSAGPYSSPSRAVRAVPFRMDPTKVSLGYMMFVGMDGGPARGRVIIASHGPPIMGSYIRYAPASAVFEANEEGLLQVPLLRLARVTVAIEGTSLVREIEVPNAASFDLATAIGAAPDELTVKIVPPLATRRSL